jgi:hypothetical protein
MSLKIKSLIQQLHPIFTADACIATPKFSTKQPYIKHSVNTKSYSTSRRHVSAKPTQISTSIKTSNKLNTNGEHVPDNNNDNNKIRKSLFTNSKPKKSSSSTSEDQSDSGLESSSKSIQFYKINNQNADTSFKLNTTCKYCLHQLNHSNELRNKLFQAHVNYVKSNLATEAHFANIPMLVVRSFRPSLTSTNKIQVQRGTAINALYMIDDKWVYVKTGHELKGFIPKKCCEPFATDLMKCIHRKQNSNKKSKADNNNHTYMSIDHFNISSKKIKTTRSTQKTAAKRHNISNSNRNHSMIKLLTNSKSRNRKLSLAFQEKNAVNSKLTLTLLDEVIKHDTGCLTYDQLATMNSRSVENRNNVLDYPNSPSSLYYNQDVNSKSPRIVSHGYESQDFLSSSSCSSITTISPLNNINNSQHHYDVLMTYNSANSNKTPHLRKNVVNCRAIKVENSPKNNLNMFKIISDYDAKYNKDLSVCKNDIVYSVKNETQSKHADCEDEWLFVRLYKRSQASNNNKNDTDYQINSNDTRLNLENTDFDIRNDAKMLQGFIPRCKAVKLFN